MGQERSEHWNLISNELKVVWPDQKQADIEYIAADEQNRGNRETANFSPRSAGRMSSLSRRVMCVSGFDG
jgi:hypothetical protein